MPRKKMPNGGTAGSKAIPDFFVRKRVTQERERSQGEDERSIGQKRPRIDSNGAVGTSAVEHGTSQELRRPAYNVRSESAGEQAAPPRPDSESRPDLTISKTAVPKCDSNCAAGTSAVEHGTSQELRRTACNVRSESAGEQAAPPRPDSESRPDLTISKTAVPKCDSNCAAGTSAVEHGTSQELRRTACNVRSESAGEQAAPPRPNSDSESGPNMTGSKTALPEEGSTSESSSSSDEEDRSEPGTKKGAKKISKRALQKYCVSWESKLNWLASSEKGRDFAYCKVCDKNMKCNGGMRDLVKHGGTDAHVKLEKQVSSNETIDKYLDPVKTIKDAEIKICAWAAEKNKSAVDVEEYVKLSKAVYTDSKIAGNMALGRTKATAITKKVLGKSHEEELVESMKKYPFSLMIDESTDIAGKKALVLVVRIQKWEGDEFIIRDQFYHVLELAEADAVTIYNAILKKFRDDGVPYQQNLIGFGADGANVMMGGNLSVAALLKRDCPHLFIMKCVCHSFALCASYACKALPDEIDWVLKEIYTFLTGSPLRLAKFAELQTIMDLKPKKMLHPSATRWLSLELVVNRFLERLDVLLIFFSFGNDKDKKAAEKITQIHRVLAHPSFHIYLEFMSFVIPKINSLNKLFQSESPQIYKLHEESTRLLKTIMDCFIKPECMKTKNLDAIQLVPHSFMELDKMYMGTKVQMLIEKYTKENKLTSKDVHKIRLDAMNYYITLVNQIRKRFDFSNEVLMNMAIIDPKNVLSKAHQSILPLLKHFPTLYKAEEMQAIDDEYREARNVMDEWSNGSDIPTGPEFWTKVLSTRNMGGDLVFPLLKRIIPSLLSSPHSSAAVERIFSTYNLNKTKPRNCLSTPTMEGILSAREYVKSHKPEKGVVVDVTDAARNRMTKDMYK